MVRLRLLVQRQIAAVPRQLSTTARSTRSRAFAGVLSPEISRTRRAPSLENLGGGARGGGFWDERVGRSPTTTRRSSSASRRGASRRRAHRPGLGAVRGRRRQVVDPAAARARELLSKLYGEGDEQAVAAADMLGRALGAEGDVGGATEACRASIRYKEELYGTDSVEVADAQWNAGVAAADGRRGEGRRWIARGVRALPEAVRRAPRLHRHRAQQLALLSSGAPPPPPPAARPHARRRRRPPAPRHTPRPLTRPPPPSQSLDELEAAESALRRCLKAYASVVGAGHADAVAALSLVEVLWAQGKLADAETMLSKQLHAPARAARRRGAARDRPGVGGARDTPVATRRHRRRLARRTARRSAGTTSRW